MVRRHLVNEAFFDTWSDSMAYVLGYMFADGNLEYSPSIRGAYIRFFSTDLDRVELIRSLMQSCHNLYVRKSDGRRKEAYLLKIGSHVLFEALTVLGVTTRKSHTCQFPNVPDKFLPSFILGYFDGDGCVFIERSRNGHAKKLLSVFTSGSPDFLHSLHQHLVTLTGIKGRGLYPHGSSSNCYQLRYSTRDSIRLFMLMYNSPFLIQVALLRKYDIFIKYFNEQGVSLYDLPVIFEEKGPVVNRKHGGLQNRYSAGSTPAWASTIVPRAGLEPA